MKSLRDSASQLAEFDVAYYMVSLDDPDKNRDFAESLNAGFPVLGDPDKKAAKEYGVLALAGLFAKRWTFFIGVDGLVEYVDKDVSTKSHGQDIVKRLEALGVPRSSK
jgi:peroxiredoxin Q/BCP